MSVIHTASHRVTTTIPLGTTNDQPNHIPTGVALSPEGDIWVACNTSSSLVVIDPSSNTVRQSIDIGLGAVPTCIAFT